MVRTVGTVLPIDVIYRTILNGIAKKERETILMNVRCDNRTAQYTHKADIARYLRNTVTVGEKDLSYQGNRVSMDDINFCPTCGKELPAGSTFCLACGTNLNNPVKSTAPMNNFDEPRNQKRIDTSVILLFICAAIGLITGIAGVVASDAVADMFFGGVWDSMEAEMTEMGFTWADMLAEIEFLGMVLVFGGVLALIAAVLAQKRRVWIAAFAMSLISMLILALTVLGFILCFVAVWKLYKARSAFTD